MRKYILIPLLLVALALAGCMQLETATVIDKKGGGEMSCTITMKPDVMEAMKQMQELDSDFADQDLSMVMAEKEMKDFCKEKGIKLEKYKAIEEKDRVGSSFTISFAELDGLQGLFGGGGAGLFKMEDGNYILKNVDAEDMVEETYEEEVDSESMEEAFDPEKMGKQMEIMGTLMAAAADLNVKMTITVPGDVISHNGTSVDGRTCVWEINSSNMMAAGDMEPEIIFSGKGLKIDAPAY